MLRRYVQCISPNLRAKTISKTQCTFLFISSASRNGCHRNGGKETIYLLQVNCPVAMLCDVRSKNRNYHALSSIPGAVTLESTKLKVVYSRKINSF